MRLDKFLKVSRLIKRRTVANEACDNGRISVNGRVVKASYEVKVGDKLELNMGSRTIAVDALVAACGPDGIISTHPNLIRHAHTLGLLTIQRAFVLDSLSLDTLFSQQSLCQPDFIEVLPGIMPPIITEISQKTQTPLIAGGLIRTKQDVLSAMNAGAAAVSTSARSVWKL